jgi:hypothetical protein
MGNSATKAANPYGVHPAVHMTIKWVSELKDKTGRSLEEWTKHIRTKGPKDEAAARDWLKREYGLGTNSAWWLAERAFGKGGDEDSEEGYLAAAQRYVQEQYAGKRAHLRPIYDALLKEGLALGSDVKACPCKTIVPLYREHVFAQIKPATNTRIDLGLCLRGQRAKGRLTETGGEKKGDRITHKVEITSLSDVDDEVRAWLRRAYAADA